MPLKVDKKTLPVYNVGGDFVNVLLGKNEHCYTMDVGEPFATGVYGSVSDLLIDGVAGEYVVKSFKSSASDENDDLINIYDVSSNRVKFAMTYTGEEFGDVMWPNSVLETCIKKKDGTIVSNVTGESIVIPAPMYICTNEIYTEYVISLLVSELVRQGRCINFVETIDFVACPETLKADRYVIMEKVDGTLHDITPCVFTTHGNSRDMSNGVLLQVLFAIAMYQHTYRITHNDIKTDNIMFKHVTEDMMWNGERVIDAEYFHYHVNGVDIYFPASPIIVKIADWGIASKWSQPYIQSKDPSPIMPNDYSEQYDALQAIFLFARRSHGLPRRIFEEVTGIIPESGTFGKTLDTLTASDTSYGVADMSIRRLRQMLDEYGIPYGNDWDADALHTALGHQQSEDGRWFNVTTYEGRPSLEAVRDYPDATALNILTNEKLMANFFIPPPEGAKIMTLGRI